MSQVLVILFTLTENPELLSLHARQQHSRYEGENSASISGWIKCLAHGLQVKLEKDKAKPFLDEGISTIPNDYIVEGISTRLGALAKVLHLYPYDSKGKFTGKLKAVSNESIQAVHVICPDAVVCETASCKPWSLLQKTKLPNIPRVTLIKGSRIYTNIQVLTGIFAQNVKLCILQTMSGSLSLMINIPEYT